MRLFTITNFQHFMKQLYITITLLFIFNLSSAQKNFKSGFILQNGDTIRGLVDYRGDVRSSQLVTFKQNETTPEQAYTPEDIQAYGFDQEQKYFEAHVLPAVEGGASTRLFLNVLAKGKASLYHYRDTFQKENYYLSKDNGPLVELAQEVYYITDASTGQKRKVTDKKFVTVLSSVFSDCNEVSQTQLKKVSYNASSLTSIVQAYNQCVAPGSSVYVQKKKKGAVTIAPVFGYFTSSLKVTGSHRLVERNYDKSTTHFTGGVSFNFTIPSINEKLSIQTELLYFPQKFYSYHYEKNQMGRTTTSEITFDQSYLKLPAQLRYTFPKGKIRPFINAGPVLAYAVKLKDNEVVHSSFMSSSYTEEGPVFPDNESVRPYSMGLASGAGISYLLKGKALSLEARYEINDGFSVIDKINTRIRSTYFILSYAL